MNFCPKCGTQNNDGTTFCSNCGTNLSAPSQGAAYVVNAATPGKGLAIASMVCGIVSFFCFGIILGILAVIFGAIAKSKGYRGGMATTGIVLGVVGLAVYLVLLLSFGSALIPFMEL